MSQKYLNIREHRTFLNEKSPMSAFLMSAFLWHPLSTITTKYFFGDPKLRHWKARDHYYSYYKFRIVIWKKEWLTENWWQKFHDIDFRNFVTVTKFLLTFNDGHEIFLDRHDFFWNLLWYMGGFLRSENLYYATGRYYGMHIFEHQTKT